MNVKRFGIRRIGKQAQNYNKTVSYTNISLIKAHTSHNSNSHSHSHFRRPQGQRAPVAAPSPTCGSCEYL